MRERIVLPEHLKKYIETPEYEHDELIDSWNSLSKEERQLVNDYRKQIGEEYRIKAEEELVEKRQKEVVWRKITRADIESNFSKNETYSVGDVASKLGLDYVQAFRYIVPWMRKEGYKVGKGKSA